MVSSRGITFLVLSPLPTSTSTFVDRVSRFLGHSLKVSRSVGYAEGVPKNDKHYVVMIDFFNQ